MLDVERTLLSLLMEVGHLAGAYGFSRDAKAIFEGLAAVRPSSAYPVIGKAVVFLNQGEAQAAVQVLEAANFEMTDEGDLGRAFLALALNSAGFSAAAETLCQSLEVSSNQIATAMAAAIMAELRAA